MRWSVLKNTICKRRRSNLVCSSSIFNDFESLLNLTEWDIFVAFKLNVFFALNLRMQLRER